MKNKRKKRRQRHVLAYVWEKTRERGRRLLKVFRKDKAAYIEDAMRDEKKP